MRREASTRGCSPSHNTAIDLLRRSPANRWTMANGISVPAPDALAVVLAGERAAILAAAVRELPALYREALTLRFEEG